jgi:hypothetical protein
VALVPESFGRFGGLRLDLPLDEVGAERAIDALDVELSSETGLLQPRVGSEVVKAQESSEGLTALFAHSDNAMIFCFNEAAGKAKLKYLNAANEVPAGAEETLATKGGLHFSFARLGTPSASYTYIARRGTSGTTETLGRFDGTKFKEPTATVDGEAGKAMPKGHFVTAWPDGGNRLVVAGTTTTGGPNGAASSDSYVWFSEPGNAEAYESTAYVQLMPGDGEEITGCCVWGGYLFVFKETRFFVFYGVSVDEEGRPEFNYRAVEIEARIRRPLSIGLENWAVAPGGVFFVSDDGVWLTTGGTPARISEELLPLGGERPLLGPIATTLPAGNRQWAQVNGLFYSNFVLYVTMNERVLAYNLHTGTWVVWKGNISSGMAAWRGGVYEGREYVYFVTLKTIYRYNGEKEADAAVTMEPRWQSGFYDFSDPDEKTLTETKLYGTGKPKLAVAKDFGEVGTAKEITLTTEGTTPKQGRTLLAQTGTLFSHKFSGTAPWSVQRITRYLEAQSVPASKRK